MPSLIDRYIFLFRHIKYKHHSCGIHNLYISERFFNYAYMPNNKFLMFGLNRKLGRGFTDRIKQYEVTSKAEIISERGAVKYSVLVGGIDCLNLVTDSGCDTKNVCFLSDSYDRLVWI